jgi:acyl carrier protein
MSEAKLRNVFVSALGIAPDYPLDDLRYRGIEEWDSVAHMTLVSSLEEAFDIMLETNDVIDMSSYVKAREILGKYGVAF